MNKHDMTSTHDKTNIFTSLDKDGSNVEINQQITTHAGKKGTKPNLADIHISTKNSPTIQWDYPSDLCGTGCPNTGARHGSDWAWKRCWTQKSMEK